MAGIDKHLTAYDDDDDALTRSELSRARATLTCTRCGARTVPMPHPDDPERRVCVYLATYGSHRDKAE